jgi:hypothetical protein
VFFYQNSFGSRVFFDELGPPWPKHPCTDNGATVRLRSGHPSPGSRPIAIMETSWSKDNWIALRAEKQSLDDDWILLRCINLLNDELVRILLTDFIDLTPNFPVYMKAWDEEGRTTIAFLDRDFTETEAKGYKFATWFMRKSEDTAQSLKVGE